MQQDGIRIDEALETAVERVRGEETRFLEEPPGTPASVARAHRVEQRAEEVEELATEAVEAPTVLPNSD